MNWATLELDAIADEIAGHSATVATRWESESLAQLERRIRLVSDALR